MSYIFSYIHLVAIDINSRLRTYQEKAYSLLQNQLVIFRDHQSIHLLIV